MSEMGLKCPWYPERSGASEIVAEEIQDARDQRIEETFPKMLVCRSAAEGIEGRQEWYCVSGQSKGGHFSTFGIAMVEVSKTLNRVPVESSHEA